LKQGDLNILFFKVFSPLGYPVEYKCVILEETRLNNKEYTPLLLPIQSAQAGTEIEHYVSDIRHLTFCILIRYRRKYCWTEVLTLQYRLSDYPILEQSNIKYKQFLFQA
jgi:hypothetical protein